MNSFDCARHRRSKAAETEIRCAWPAEVTAAYKHGSFCATVSHWDGPDDYCARDINAAIKLAG